MRAVGVKQHRFMRSSPNAAFIYIRAVSSLFFRLHSKLGLLQQNSSDNGTSEQKRRYDDY